MGLGSNSNLYFSSNDNPVTDLFVEIVISQDLALYSSYSHGTPQNPQYSFQLNAWSSASGNAAWQQYVFLISAASGTPTLTTRIEYWPSTAYANSGTPGISPTGEFLHAALTTLRSDPIGLPETFEMPTAQLSSLTLVAGTHLSFTLSTDPSGNVIAVTFNAFGPDNHSWFEDNAPIDIGSLYTNPNPHSHPPTPAVPLPQNALSPIYAFQLVLVGSDNGHALLTSGAGTIFYTATVPLPRDIKQPSWSGDQREQTAETGNSVYGNVTELDEVLPGYSSYSQPFGTCGYVPGGFLVAGPLFGNAQRTNLFAIGSTGQLTLFYVSSSNKWRQYRPVGSANFPPYGPLFAPPGAALAVSNQFGLPNQTDVFVVDSTGQLNVFWCANSDGDWSGPRAISQPPFAAPPGAPVAATTWVIEAAPDADFGVNLTGVFVVDDTGTLMVLSVANDGPWSAPRAISDPQFAAPGAAVAAYNSVSGHAAVFVIDLNGAVAIFSASATGGWSAPKIISSLGFIAPANAPIAVSARYGVEDQVDIYVVDQVGQLHVFSLISLASSGIPGGEFWVGGTIGPAFAAPGSPVAVSRQFGVADQNDVFVVDDTGALNVFWANGNAAWNGPLVIAQNGEGVYGAPTGSTVAASNQFGLNDQTDVFLMINAPGGLTFPPLGWPAVCTAQQPGVWNQPAALILQV